MMNHRVFLQMIIKW